MTTFRVTLINLVMAACLPMLGGVAQAAPTSQLGHITNVVYSGDALLIALDGGLPGNCTGTLFGVMMLPAARKTMIAFVTGLYLRGDMASVQSNVYTTAVDGSGYCQIEQIDPPG